MTLAELRTAIRQRADMVNSQFVTDLELNSYINQSYFELYDILVQKFGNDYFVADPHDFVTDNNDFYDLPDDFFKLLGVDRAINASAGQYVEIQPFTFASRNRSALSNTGDIYKTSGIRYRLKGNQLWLTPRPTTGTQIRLWYSPKMQTLDADGDTVDGISGWTEYIIIDGAIKCGQKEETDVSVLMAQKMAMLARIEASAENRDAGSPSTVTDVMSDYYSDGEY